MASLKPEVLLERIDLLRRGLSDSEIAKRQGVKKQAIYLWRYRYEARALDRPASGATDPNAPKALDLPAKPTATDVDLSWRHRAEAAQREAKHLREELSRLARECQAAVDASKKRYTAILIDLSMHHPVAPPPPTPTPPPPRPPPQPLPDKLTTVERQILAHLEKRGGTAIKSEVLGFASRPYVDKALRWLRRRGLARVVVNFSDGRQTRVELVKPAQDHV